MFGFSQDIRARQREANKYIAVFPCRLRILPDCIFNARDPIVLGVHIVEGIIREGTPICIPNKEFLEIGVVSSLEFDHNVVETAKKGQDVCIKITSQGDKKMIGRHFEVTDELVSKVRVLYPTVRFVDKWGVLTNGGADNGVRM